MTRTKKRSRPPESDEVDDLDQLFADATSTLHLARQTLREVHVRLNEATDADGGTRLFDVQHDLASALEFCQVAQEHFDEVVEMIVSHSSDAKARLTRSAAS